MGCDETKDNYAGVLIAFFEQGNESQKEYCLKLKDNFRHSKSIKYEIKEMNLFSIQFRLRNKSEPFKIQENPDLSDEALKKALNDMYNILDNPNPK